MSEVTKRTVLTMRAFVKVVGTISLTAGLLGGACWVFGFTAKYLPISESWRLPLGEPRGIAVDSRGRIYVGSQFYGRIQRYRTNGAFENGFFVDTEGGTFDLWLEGDDRIHVHTYRGERHLVYSPAGELIESTGWPDGAESVDNRHEAHVDGATFVIRRPAFRPIVVRIGNGSEATVLVKDSAFLWLLGGPLPAFAIVLTGLVAFAACRLTLRFCHWHERGRQSLQPPTVPVSESN